MRRLNVRCLPPCVNRSGPDFTVEQDAEGLAVRYALGALKGVGEKAMGDLVAERERGGPFTSLDDFAGRLDTRRLNKRQLYNPAGAGGFDSITTQRASVHATAQHIMGHQYSAPKQPRAGAHTSFGA